MYSNYTILTRLTFAFFGLEESIWDKIERQEQQKFNTMTFVVLLLAAIIFLGMYEFFILLLNEVIYALILGAILTLVVLNIIRFSVFTIQKPIFYIPEEVKPAVTPDTIAVEPTTTTSTPSVITKYSNQLKQVYTRISDNLSFELFVRIIINGILLLFIVLPFACLLNGSQIAKLNEAKRNELLSNFIQSEQQNLDQKIEKLDLKINTLKNKIQSTQNDMYYAELGSELSTNAKLISDWEQNKNRAISNFEQFIANKNFIIYSYKTISKQISFKLCLLTIGLLLLLCHVQKYSLVNQSTNSYYQLANKYYYTIALNNYIATEELIKQELAKKYTDKSFYNQLIENYEKWKSTGRYLNPPFNSQEREFKVPTKQVSPSEFINLYSAK
jgi:hypothetical protein